MNINEETKRLIIEKINKLMTEINTLISENSSETNEVDILADYIDAFTVRDRMYYIDGDGDVDFVMYDLPFDATESNPYGHYPTKKLAEQAKAMKVFNDKLLAYKYCYDADYEPNWSDISSNKYYVYYDAMSDRYKAQYSKRFQWNCTVYFSTYAIAQKCADWLNGLKEE